jgi:hypothetical protein
MTWIYPELKGREKLQWAINELRYEMAEGIHTYSPCECGRHGCRANKCYQCWEEEIDKLMKKIKTKMTCSKCGKIFYNHKIAGEHAMKEHHYEFKTKNGGNVDFL